MPDRRHIIDNMLPGRIVFRQFVSVPELRGDPAFEGLTDERIEFNRDVPIVEYLRYCRDFDVDPDWKSVAGAWELAKGRVDPLDLRA